MIVLAAGLVLVAVLTTASCVWLYRRKTVLYWISERIVMRHWPECRCGELLRPCTHGIPSQWHHAEGGRHHCEDGRFCAPR